MLSRNLDKAREAFKKKDVELTKKAHQESLEAEEKHKQEHGQYIKSLIYGGLDGIITTFGISPFSLACILTGITLFSLGALKVKVTDRNWFVSGIEMLVVGGIAAASAYGIGVLLSGLA